MIFLTVGTQLAFDRLVQAVDIWAGANPRVEVFAQVGPTKALPKHMAAADFVSPSRADELVRRADLIVSHAGMGSILMALRCQKPIVILPRQATLGEHRNDHQMATARWLAERPGIKVAWDEHGIAPILDCRHSLAAGPQLPEVASGALVDRLTAYIKGGVS